MHTLLYDCENSPHQLIILIFGLRN